MSGVGQAKHQQWSELCVVHDRSDKEKLHNEIMKNYLKNDKAIPELPAVDHLVKTS